MLTFSQEKTISGEQIIENYLLNLQAIDNLKGKITIIENRISTLNPSMCFSNSLSIRLRYFFVLNPP